MSTVPADRARTARGGGRRGGLRAGPGRSVRAGPAPPYPGSRVGNAEAHVDEQRTADGDVERDDSFHEAAALDEIELFSELLIATSSRTAPLSPGELDSLLGVRG